MKAVFLCGGCGNRMFPITENKFLLGFLGKPLLQHQMEMAQEAGLSQFVIIGNPGNIERIEQIATAIPGIQVEFALQEKPLGIADALRSAGPLLGGQVLVVNPNDVFSSTAYSSISSESGKNSSSGCMLGYQVNEYFPGGYLEVDSRGHLKHIIEKPAPGEEPGDLVNILVHLHNDAGKLLDYIDQVESDRDDVYERALDRMVQDGHEIRVIPYTGLWAPIKYPWHILRVMDDFLGRVRFRVSPSVRIMDRALIEGKVFLSDNVTVMENAVIRGPAYIGPNSVIGNGALLRGYCHIGANSVVGYCTEVKHSYIGDNCWFHSNYIGDSIIDDDCSFGSGAITANFRLDEGNIHIKVNRSRVDTGYDKLGAFVGQGCRLGVNASLMPGVRVGRSSFVGPHVCLSHDLEANKKALPAPQYVISDNGRKPARGKRQELLRRLER